MFKSLLKCGLACLVIGVFLQGCAFFGETKTKTETQHERFTAYVASENARAELEEYRAVTKVYFDEAFMEMWRYPVTIKSFNDIVNRMMIFNIWAQLVEKGESMPLDAAERAWLADRSLKAVSVQKTALPLLRKAYGMLMAQNATEERITVYGKDYGDIEFMSEIYTNVDNIKNAQAFLPLFESLRFKTVYYRAYAETCYAAAFNLNRFNDEDLLIWEDLQIGSRKLGY